MRLSEATINRCADHVVRPRYNRADRSRRIVHLGLGAFARAHLAVYTDEALNAGDEGWSITGISLRSPTVRDQLSPQDGLYMVEVRSAEGTAYRLIGVLDAVIVLPEEPEAAIEALSDPATAIVTLTVTEKGYWRAPSGELDCGAADVAHDLAGKGPPRTIYGLIHAALRRRHDAGSDGMTIISCDNLASNGKSLKRMLGEFLASRDPDLSGWVDETCGFPSTMVDRIAPATSDRDRVSAEAETGVRDEGLVVTEPFAQWVIEDCFVGQRPKWEANGAQFVDDVAPYEAAKLRMLNGAHSALAYLGLDRSHAYVHEAMADPMLGDIIERLMRKEAAPTIVPDSDQDLEVYGAALIKRFANPALDHRLDQIAMDGSQKIAQRWLQTLAWHDAHGTQCPAILTALAAWLRHVRGDRRPVDDPLADRLAASWREYGPGGIVTALLAADGLLESAWQPDASQIDYLIDRLGGSQ